MIGKAPTPRSEHRFGLVTNVLYAITTCDVYLEHENRSVDIARIDRDLLHARAGSAVTAVGPAGGLIPRFGWFVGLRGLLLLATPTVIRSGVDATALSTSATILARIFFGVLAVVGVLLTYAGWFATPVEARPAVPSTTASVA